MRHGCRGNSCWQLAEGKLTCWGVLVRCVSEAITVIEHTQQLQHVFFLLLEVRKNQ
jgi:hypothetical protein